jgi:phytanoyl-CoA hydroxylase
MTDQTAQIFDGCVDRSESGWILGWAWRTDRPLERLRVDVYVGTARVATSVADIYRPDLERAGKGDGRHAFEVRLPRLAAESDPSVRIVFAATNQDLPGSPFTITAHETASSRNDVPQPPPGATYRSRFGGLWPDLSNALELIAEKQTRRHIAGEDADRLRSWIAQGFVVLPSAVDAELIDQLDAEVDEIWNGASPHRCFVESWENGVSAIQLAGPGFKDLPVKLLDLYAHSETARRIVFAPSILRFLTLLFEQAPVAFQSLYFRGGSRQDAHQDTAFVKVSSPMRLAASWIALEDIQQDSGELEYYVRSHLLDDYLFEGRHKWMPFKSPEYDAYVASLHTRSRAQGLERRKFRPKKGDALIWSADLVHGGSRDIAPGLTRKSIVTHYCPSDCEPIYSGDVAAVRYPVYGTASYTVEQRK